MPDTVIPVRLEGTRAAPPGSLYCNFLWDSLTLLSDGKLTCGFDDPFGTRSYGNIATATIREIFNSEGVRSLREKLLGGAGCVTCHLYSAVGGEGVPVPPEMPRRLIVESTIRCNLRCRNTSCDINNDRHSGVRSEPFLSFDLFRKAIDEAGPHLGILYFFNYGEPFLHPRAVDMLAYARRVNPNLYIATSTNGLLLRRGDAARRIVEEDLLYWMNFTIAGSDDPTYQIYHKGGSFEEAIDGMRAVIEEKRRLGKRYPTVRWRYLLFNWNDSDAQLARARELAAQIGVDEFTFFLCSGPLEGRTRLRAPGAPGHAAIADALDREVHYIADPFADRGLYPPEADARLGSYCWTCRHARVRLEPSAGRARLFLARQGPAAALAARVRVKTPWGEAVAEVGNGAWEANEIVLPEGLADTPFEAEILVDEVFIPFRHDHSGDTRELGVMVSLAFAEKEPRVDGTGLGRRTGVPAAGWVESAAVLPSGIRGVASVWISNGEYAIGEGPFTSEAGVLLEGESVRVRHESARGPGMGTETLLCIGGACLEFASFTAPWESWLEVPEEQPSAEAPAPGPDVEDAAAFVARLYEGILWRDADEAGAAWWEAQLAAGMARVEPVEYFLDCEELHERVAPVVRLFLASTRRIPDLAGVCAWIARRRDGMALETIARALSERGEFALRYEALEDVAFVDALHRDLVGRNATPEEQTSLASLPRHEVLLALSRGPAFRDRSANRVTATIAYVGLLRRAPDPTGYDFWPARMDRTGGRREFIDAILSSNEVVVPARKARRVLPLVLAAS